MFIRPDTGDIVQTDHYRPTTGQVRALRARDVTCRFPGCEIVAASCDIDHTHPHSDGGPTTNSNLAHLCEEHHMLKHHSGWRVAQLPGGVMRWTAPSGRCYDTHPRSRVFFRDEDHGPGTRTPGHRASAPAPASTPAPANVSAPSSTSAVSSTVDDSWEELSDVYAWDAVAGAWDGSVGEWDDAWDEIIEATYAAEAAAAEVSAATAAEAAASAEAATARARAVPAEAGAARSA